MQGRMQRARGVRPVCLKRQEKEASRRRGQNWEPGSDHVDIVGHVTECWHMTGQVKHERKPWVTKLLCRKEQKLKLKNDSRQCTKVCTLYIHPSAFEDTHDYYRVT